MKLCRLLSCLLVGLVLPLTLAAQSAASAGRGGISGRVQNAATGLFLSNARVAVKGTDVVGFTDAYGIYRLTDVPAGPLVLQVFFTDLDPQEIPLTLSAGEHLERDIGLTNTARYGADAALVRMDAFAVSTQRETDAAAIATNEQRFAPNIKNVLATNAFGDVFGNSAGDFLKFMPGLAVDYDNADVSNVSVRGIGAAMTGVLFDGAPIVTGANTGPTRTVEMRTQALNNISRVDVTKVPTPSTPADSLGGSVNMVSKSAFERSGREFHYGLNLSGNLNDLPLRPTPQPYEDRDTWKYKPGFDFDFTLPITKDFGFVFTGMDNQKFRDQNITRKTWSAAGTSTGASFSQPFLQSYQIQDAPRTTSATVFSLKVDWRVTPNSIFTIGGRWGRNIRAQTGSVVMTPTVGTIGTPTITPGVSFSYGPTFAIGATGRGNVALTNSWQFSRDDTYGANVGYRYDDGKWRVESNLNRSGSDAILQTTLRGNFSSVVAALRNPVRVSFLDIGPDRPREIHVYDNNNREIDMTDISNYRISTASSDNREHILNSRYANLDIRRRLDLFPVPTALQVGGLRRIENVDANRPSATWTFTGANDSLAQFLNKNYINQDASMGFKNLPQLNMQTAWQAYQRDPSLFTQTLAQQVATENARITSSQFIEETVSAAYVQAEARLLDNRLNVLTGVRFEQTRDAGQGLLQDPNGVFVRNADGTFARNAQGVRIRKPEAGAVGSLEELRVTRKERGFVNSRTYHGYYPSLHLTYNLRENIIVRLAYAKTYGRPDFGDIIPTATVQDADLSGTQVSDPTVSKGDITVTNTALRPWSADNYDLAVEYYTPQGGFLSAGVFRKNIRDFFGTDVRVATLADLQLIGLDSRYVGWTLRSQFNSGDARIDGFEVSLRQSLAVFGAWGRHLTVFANATHLNLQGDAEASFQNFIPDTANAGFSFNWKRLTVMPRLNYRGLNKLIAQPAFGPDGFQYIKPRKILDVSFSYQLTARVALTGAMNNALNDHLTQRHYSSLTPGYARRSLDGEYGTAFSLGIRGSF